MKMEFEDRSVEAKNMKNKIQIISRDGEIKAEGRSRRPSGLRKTRVSYNSLAHRTTWLRSDFPSRPGSRRRARPPP